MNNNNHVLLSSLLSFFAISGKLLQIFWECRVCRVCRVCVCKVTDILLSSRANEQLLYISFFSRHFSACLPIFESSKTRDTTHNRSSIQRHCQLVFAWSWKCARTKNLIMFLCCMQACCTPHAACCCRRCINKIKAEIEKSWIEGNAVKYNLKSHKSMCLLWYVNVSIYIGCSVCSVLSGVCTVYNNAMVQRCSDSFRCFLLTTQTSARTIFHIYRLTMW